MKIEPTGVVFVDICSIQTQGCVATAAAPITAVWSLPGRVQVNVCRVCLEEQIRSGEWEIQGAKIAKRADLVVYSPDSRLQLVVEVKKKPSGRVSNSWATMVHRNLLVHGGIPNTPYFLLAVPPDYLYLWKQSDSTDFERKPDYEIEANKVFEKYARKQSLSPRVTTEHFYLEQIVSSWLEDLVQSKPFPEDPSCKWLYESGLYDAIKEGSVVMQATVAA